MITLLAAIAAYVLYAVGVFTVKPHGVTDEDYEPGGAAFEAAEFEDIDDWRVDSLVDALAPFARSCARIVAMPAEARMGAPTEGDVLVAGVAGDWRAACEDAIKISALNFAEKSAGNNVARDFFERHFRAVKIYQRLPPKPGGKAAGMPSKLTSKGRFTAYFEPFYEARPARSAEFSAPVYARPEDLVTVDLGVFRTELAGQRIAGRIVSGALDPYPDHKAINAGAIVGNARVLAWMRPTDLFFLQIQGSGRLLLPSGAVRVGYDGANGRPYTAIGRTLIELGALTRETVSMKTIRDWLDGAGEAKARAIRETNQSYVFFQVLDNLPDKDLGPLGAEGMQLTPGRSIAVDPRYVSYGAPVWVSIGAKEGDGKIEIRRLLIAQDTGGAIKGAVRGDIFVGSGPEAGEVAGGFNEIGEIYVLLPAALAARLPKQARP